MPIKYPFRAIAVGLLLAAGASPIVMAQNPTSSRRPKILERLPALVQETEQPAEETVTVTAAQESAPPVRQTAGVAPSKTASSKKTGSTKAAAPKAMAPKGMTSVSKATKPSVQTAARQAQAEAVPEPTAVPAMPADASAAPSAAASGQGGYKTTPTDVGSQGPYVRQRVQYRRDQFKYRWDHYYKPSLQESHWGYPEEFCEKPLGYYSTANAKTMVANAEAARMILHDMDFVGGEARLNERGREQLAKIAYMLPRNYFPLIIAQSGDDMALSESRRTAIMGLLTESGFPVPEQRVVLATPIARGLVGPEGEFSGNTYLGSFQQGGVTYGYYQVFSDLDAGTFGGGGGGGSTNANVGGGGGGGSR